MIHVVIFSLDLRLTADSRVATRLGCLRINGGRVRNLSGVRIERIPVVGVGRQFDLARRAVRGSVLHRELDIRRPGGGTCLGVEDGKLVAGVPFRGHSGIDGTGGDVAQDDFNLPALAGEVSFLVTTHKGKGGSGQTRKEKGFSHRLVSFRV